MKTFKPLNKLTQIEEGRLVADEGLQAAGARAEPQPPLIRDPETWARRASSALAPPTRRDAMPEETMMPEETNEAFGARFARTEVRRILSRELKEQLEWESSCAEAARHNHDFVNDREIATAARVELERLLALVAS